MGLGRWATTIEVWLRLILLRSRAEEPIAVAPRQFQNFHDVVRSLDRTGVRADAAVVQGVFGDGAELARADADGGKVGGEVQGECFDDPRPRSRRTAKAARRWS
jgi:hypothetical protein